VSPVVGEQRRKPVSTNVDSYGLKPVATNELFAKYEFEPGRLF
jgi:hypothetical protein